MGIQMVTREIVCEAASHWLLGAIMFNLEEKKMIILEKEFLIDLNKWE